MCDEAISEFGKMSGRSTYGIIIGNELANCGRLGDCWGSYWRIGKLPLKVVRNNGAMENKVNERLMNRQ